jgi:hypothetical protein
VTQTLETARTERLRGKHGASKGQAVEQPAAVRAATFNPAAAKMRRAPRIAIGVGLLLFAGVVLAHLMWAWSIAARLVPDSAGVAPAAIRAHWLGYAFTPTLTFMVLLIVALSAMAGSTAATAMVFSNRAGQNQLEKYWVWWYVLRPGVAAVIAVVAFVSVKAGFLGTLDDTKTKGLAFAAALGGLTGLFTDKMLEKLQVALGFSPFTDSAVGGVAPAPGDVGTPAPADAVAADAVITMPDVAETALVPPQRMPEVIDDLLPEQTDNRPVPEDGDQDVDQESTPVPGSPTGHWDAP